MKLLLVTSWLALWVSESLTQFHPHPCVLKSSCSCLSDLGYVDLHSLAFNNGTPWFKDIKDPDGKTLYSWNPCYPFSESKCHNVALAQIRAQGNNCTSLGDQPSLNTASTKYGVLEFVYTNSDAHLSGHVIITCDISVFAYVLHRRPDIDFKENNFTHLYFELRSPRACPQEYTTPSTTRSTTTTTPLPRAPIFDDSALGGLMIGILVMLLVVMILIAGLFCHVTHRLHHVII